MESKKQLIFIPPMSEALKKLNEVLEGIATEENIEITVIDDLKELSQFVANTGQCIILSSNAKKCAQFLQDNRFILAKFHCKTILFTPKEIPAKTLVKFTKVGLTESILESSPPKTFLYKVKLLLRSIKTVKSVDDKDKELVKTMLDSNTPAEENQDKALQKEKAFNEETPESADNLPTKKSFSTEDLTIDYGTNLKSKVNPTEEAIETNWKSERKKELYSEVSEPEKEKKKTEGETDIVDMYYRGKQKKEEPLPEAEDDFDRFKNSSILDLIEEEKERKKTKADVIDEGFMREKRLEQNTYEEAVEKKKSFDLDFIEEAAKKKNITLEDTSELDWGTRDSSPEMALEDPEKEEDPVKKDELSTYMKGKIRKTQEEEQDEAPDYVDKKVYDNSEAGEEDKDASLDLELSPAARKKKEQEEQEEDQKDPLDNEVDHIETDMIGNPSTVEQIKTRMESRVDPSIQPVYESDKVIDFIKKKEEEDLPEEEKEESLSLDLEASDKKAQDEKKVYDPDDDEQNDPLLDLDLLAAEKKSLENPVEDAGPGAFRNLIGPSDEEKEYGSPSAGEPLPEEKEMGRRTIDDSTELPKSAAPRDAVSVDKIDTFMRGGSAKAAEQNWDNLTNKKDELKLIPKQKKADNETITLTESKDLGETIIDYRKLKEEFDQMEKDTVSEKNFSRTGLDSSLSSHDDEGSFKVIEISPLFMDFSILFQNSIYQKDIKPKNFFAMLAKEVFENYHGIGVFYSYRTSDNKFTEAFNAFSDLSDEKVTNFITKWDEFKLAPDLLLHFQGLSMTTWRCAEIKNGGEIWEDVELPSWAEQELTSKAVELIFPYFDGIDRMGMAIVFFPEGVNAKEAHNLLASMELARTLFLDTIDRYKVQALKLTSDEQTADGEKPEEKKKLMSFLGNLFGRKTG